MFRCLYSCFMFGFYVMFIRVSGLVCLSLLTSLSPSYAASCIVNDTDIAQNYDGPCVDGKAHGRGKASGRNRYEGSFMAGSKHGQGTYAWANTQMGSFSGVYENDVPIRGLRTTPFGTYNGGFLNGRYHGPGKETFNSKAKGNVLSSEGQFVDGKLSGTVKVVFRNGDVYEGGFSNSKRNGFGIWKRGPNVACPPSSANTLCQTRIEGNWSDDKLTSGKLAYADGDSYSGKVSYGKQGGMVLLGATDRGVGGVNLLDTMKALGGLIGGLARVVPQSEAG